MHDCGLYIHDVGYQWLDQCLYHTNVVCSQLKLFIEGFNCLLNLYPTAIDLSTSSILSEISCLNGQGGYPGGFQVPWTLAMASGRLNLSLTCRFNRPVIKSLGVALLGLLTIGVLSGFTAIWISTISHLTMYFYSPLLINCRKNILVFVWS